MGEIESNYIMKLISLTNKAKLNKIKPINQPAIQTEQTKKKKKKKTNKITHTKTIPKTALPPK